MKPTEAGISSHLKCPVGDFRPDPFWDIILATTKSILRDASSMRPRNLKEIRDLYSKAWEGMKSVTEPHAYNFGHRKIPRIALRVVYLIRDYKIVVPPVQIDLALERGTLGVDYAVAKPWRKDEPWLCVNLIRSRSPTYGQYLDPVSLSRWLDLQTRERHREIKILNVPLLAGKSWITSGLSKPLVRRQVNAILTVIEGASQDAQKFARPGAHCEACQSHKCLEMTYER
jgi:hypothetical protein